MWVDFVEVLERPLRLRQHGRRIAQVHSAHVVALKGVDEALDHSTALRAAYRRVDWLQPPVTWQAGTTASPAPKATSAPSRSKQTAGLLKRLPGGARERRLGRVHTPCEPRPSALVSGGDLNRLCMHSHMYSPIYYLCLSQR